MGSGSSGARRPGCRRRGPESRSKVPRCVSGVFLALTKLLLTEKSQTPFPRGAGKARPFLSLRRRAQRSVRLGTLGDCPRVPCEGWGACAPLGFPWGRTSSQFDPAVFLLLSLL